MADTTYQLNFTGDQINNLLTRINNLDTELDNYLLKNGGDMTGAINMNGQNISGLNDPTEESQAARKGYVDTAKVEANAYTDASVRKAAPRNLLDNSDFRNPVNQRGLTSVNVNGMFIDRWRIFSDTETNRVTRIDSNGLTTAGGLSVRQIVPAEIVPKDKSKYTFAVCDSDGKITIVYNTWKDSTGNLICAIRDAGTYIWAALYEGTYTTENLPEYQPKGYGAELAECQRYFIRYGGSYAFIAVGNVETASLAQCIIQLPVYMRLPTASLNITSDLSKFRIKSGTASAAISEINIYQRGYIVSLACTISSNFTPGSSCLLTTVAGDNFIELSADL